MSRLGSSLSLAQQYQKQGHVSFGGLGNVHDRRQPGNTYQTKTKINQKYHIVGFISSGTYGRVYKAVERQPRDLASPTTGKEVYAIKKFKPEKEGDNIQYTGLSQSAIREMSLCTELTHPNLIHLVEIILEDKCVFMVFEYCEHDLLQIIHHHTQPPRRAIPASMIRSILFQLLNGLHYLHENWVMHRDLKPANIMVTNTGAVRIGDLGLARRFDKPLASLFAGDKVVVTIWYRSPDLLLGAKHYTASIDLWAVGCIFAELLSLRPIFKGEETKMDSKKTVPFQRNQMGKIVEILGMPKREEWPGLVFMPEFTQLQQLIISRGGIPPNLYSTSQSSSQRQQGSGLDTWYNHQLRAGQYPQEKTPGKLGLDLLTKLFEFDPDKRLTAAQALDHDYFRCTEGEHEGDIWVSSNCFEGLTDTYPHRRVSTETNDISTTSLPGTKRGGLPDDSLVSSAKRR